MGVAIIGELIGLVAVMMIFGIPLAHSPVGRAIAESIKARSNPSTESFDALEARVKALETELHQVREALVLGEDRLPPGTARQRSLGAPEPPAGGPERGRQLEH